MDSQQQEEVRVQHEVRYDGDPELEHQNGKADNALPILKESATCWEGGRIPMEFQRLYRLHLPLDCSQFL